MEYIFRYIRTLRNLKWIQIAGRIKFHLIKPNFEKKALNSPVELKDISCQYPTVPQAKNQNSFTFLNVKREIGKNWDDDSIPMLWRYNLHYFDELKSHNFKERNQELSDFIENWVEHFSTPSSPSWTPYPTSLRTVNFMKWHLSEGEKGLSLKAQESLFNQLHYLSKRIEYHLQGNHLFVNGKALFFGGLFFNEEEFFKTGLEIVSEAIKEQVLDDGANFELTPMYHCIFLEDLLDLIFISQAYDFSYPKVWEQTVSKMIEYMIATTHQDGMVSHFNDSALSIAQKPQNLIDYAKCLKLEVPTPSNESIKVFKDSGLVRYEEDQTLLLIDGGPLGPGYVFSHAHSDTLSFELSYKGKRLLTNTGTSVYGQSRKRLEQRKTFSHNTIEIDEKDQSEVWGGFRVGRQAEPLPINIENNEITVAHKGYAYLQGSPIHYRTFKPAASQIIIEDQIKGSEHHKLRSFLHLHPNLRKVEMINDKCCQAMTDDGIELKITSKNPMKLEKYLYCPDFGIEIESRRLVIEHSGRLPLKNVITLDLT